jgi:hypothetical protein
MNKLKSMSSDYTDAKTKQNWAEKGGKGSSL